MNLSEAAYLMLWDAVDQVVADDSHMIYALVVVFVALWFAVRRV